MYVPKHFAVDDRDRLHDAMAARAAATLVSHGPDGLTATHVPIEVQPGRGAHGTLRCHFARANPHAAAILTAGEVLAIFQGPEAYVSPAWYPSKQSGGGRVVPTWNYVAIHAYGTATAFEGEAALRPHLEALTRQHEAGRAEPWAIDDAPDDFIATMCRGIVGIEIALTRIEGKWKKSQNRTPADRAGAAAGLRASGHIVAADLVDAART
jgi:transcriptional regulator